MTRTYYGTFHANSDYRGFYVPITALSVPAAHAVLLAVYGSHVEQVLTPEHWTEGGASLAERHGWLALPALRQQVHV